MFSGLAGKVAIVTGGAGGLGSAAARRLSAEGCMVVVVDPKSLPYLDGTQLDFAREGLNEGFKFNNPNVKDECGCGESFNV